MTVRINRWFVALVLLGFVLMGAMVFAQTLSTGSVQGTITDPSGAVVPGAKVTITNVATGRSVQIIANASGAFTSGALTPGNYKVRVEAQGFRSVETTVPVQVGVVTTGNMKMQVGQTSEVVEVQGSDVQVNTEQAQVAGVLSGAQMEALPVNGRNFLDFAQLEPGVQIQDGTNFDPTKVGYSSISFGGRFGRTARIAVDGVDVSDETVGTTTTDIPASAIQEFQLAQSDLDLSNDLTSSGAVNVTTRSGTNQVHGEAFDYFRDSSMAARLPAPPGINSPFQRSQFGGRLGGPIIKDKFFWFLDGERTLQNLKAPVALPAPFSSLSGAWNSPFRETNVLGKVDYQLTKSAHAFYRFSYFDNSAFATFFGSSFQVYDNKDITRNHVVGLDFLTGSFTHSIRFSYLKFQNQIADGSAGQPGNTTGLSLFIGPLAVGPNFLAPQSTPQSDHQVKYDGSKTLGNHIIRYGVDYNHLQGGGFAAFFSIAPVVFSDPSIYDPTICGACPGGSANPLNYPVQSITMGNGQGFSTSQPAFGFPAGGLGPDNRIGFYVGDNWKVRPNMTWTFGLRYDRDTGRTDSDLPGISQLNNLVPTYPNLGAPIRNPNLNFAPQMGVTYDPWSNGKTVIRAGIGLFYENTIWNNVLFDRPTRVPTGAFLQTASPCTGVGVAGPPIPIPGGELPVPDGVCGSGGNPITIGAAAANIIAFQHAYQAASPFTVGQNPGYIPTLLGQGLGVGSNTAPGTFAPNFQTPRSVQMNIGVQREIKPGMVFSADFVRNVTTHTLLGQDLNHVGDVRYFNMAGAMQAIAATVGPGCIPGGGLTQANASAAVGCYLAANPTATMAAFAGNGLTATSDLGVAGCPAAGCAFGGINPAVSNLNFLLPIGRSVYNGLQMKLSNNTSFSNRIVKGANYQIAYSLSRFVNPGGANTISPPSNPTSASDQDFVIGAPDNANPLRYMGPSLLDRTHQLSFGGYVTVPHGFQLGIISHFYSPLALPLVVPNSGAGIGEIFHTDFTGDGTTQDYLPGTKNGYFMRNISPGGLNNIINQYNATYANQPTPAGLTLVNNGLFTVAQLQALGAVAPSLSPAPPGEVGLGWVKAFDFSLRWDYKIRERFEIQPSVSIFNLFNFANFSLPPNTLSPYLNNAPGSVNGTTYNDQANVRVGVGTGVYGLGAPRTTEFGLRFSF
ncbi:MAG TPA: carboxypeptidase regulatory-like domain-containing protein [Terriglobales bacterium]|nr:carboxypeptidase regulatory-like domain-containing protein [Terriglobales bacterium]